jgi:hypothetical protein
VLFREVLLFNAIIPSPGVEGWPQMRVMPHAGLWRGTISDPDLLQVGIFPVSFSPPSIPVRMLPHSGRRMWVGGRIPSHPAREIYVYEIKFWKGVVESLKVRLRPLPNRTAV